MMSRLLVVAFALSLNLGLTACGGGSTEPSATETSSAVVSENAADNPLATTPAAEQDPAPATTTEPVATTTPAPTPAPDGLKTSYPDAYLECGSGRPRASLVQTFTVHFQNDTVLSFSASADSNYQDQNTANRFDPTAIAAEQHGGSTTYSGPTTAGKRAWITISTEGDIIGAGHHGETDDSYFHCGVALNGIEVAPLIQAHYPEAVMRCYSGDATSLQTTFHYEALSVDNKILSSHNLSDGSRYIEDNYNGVYRRSALADQYDFEQTDGVAHQGQRWGISVNRANDTIIGRHFQPRLPLSFTWCGSKLRLGDYPGAAKLLSKDIDPAFITPTAPTNIRCSVDGVSQLGQAQIFEDEVQIRLHGIQTIHVPLLQASGLPMTTINPQTDWLDHYRYHDGALWQIRQKGSQLLSVLRAQPNVRLLDAMRCERVQ